MDWRRGIVALFARRNEACRHINIVVVARSDVVDRRSRIGSNATRRNGLAGAACFFGGRQAVSHRDRRRIRALRFGVRKGERHFGRHCGFRRFHARWANLDCRFRRPGQPVGRPDSAAKGRAASQPASAADGIDVSRNRHLLGRLDQSPRAKEVRAMSPMRQALPASEKGRTDLRSLQTKGAHGCASAARNGERLRHSGCRLGDCGAGHRVAVR